MAVYCRIGWSFAFSVQATLGVSNVTAAAGWLWPRNGTAPLAGCSTGFSPSRLSSHWFSPYTSDRHVQDDRKHGKDQRRTLNYNLHGQMACYIVPYVSA
jgi:hypothetical protein